MSCRPTVVKLSLKLIGLLAIGVVLLPLWMGWNASTEGVLAVSRPGFTLWRHLFLPVVVPQLVWIAVITIVVLHLAVVGPIARTATWMRAFRSGHLVGAPDSPEPGMLASISAEAAGLAQSLVRARQSAEREAQLRDDGESTWTAERLRAHVRGRVRRGALFVVSNREPYMHVRRGTRVDVVVPASGLVTALEPILRACNGTWIAHGSGNADRMHVDSHDRLRVPPDQPEYALRRVWLTAEEEAGYYNGFANEGLWPLCHIAHTRPIFRASDWVCYQAANRHFADAVLDEMRDVESPTLLVQDYHCALIAASIKRARPDARVALFWHIPWPNPEAFGICPWHRELLDGLLGADLIGFHTPTHCHNFLASVDRAVESTIEWEHSTVQRQGHVTQVRPFPISVDAPLASPAELPEAARAAVQKRLGLDTEFLGLGVDRVDYTKGIVERFKGIERFLEKWERYRGRFTFVQVASPSRVDVKRYEELIREVTAEAARINMRFKTATWQPIVLRLQHHSHSEINRLYRAADVCVVTSLHDGMNLVAKEFVAARADEGGVLILSQFAGASRELRDAMIINPYNAEQIADALRLSLEMTSDEQSARMRAMRRVVGEYNVYRWAAALIGDLSDLRIDGASRVPRPADAPPMVTIEPTSLAS